MKTIREKAWVCVYCGFHMDAATIINEDVEPKEGDLTICLNCGYIYTRRNGEWKVPTEEEQAEIPNEVKHKILTYLIARKQVVREDLSEKQRKETK